MKPMRKGIWLSAIGCTAVVAQAPVDVSQLALADHVHITGNSLAGNTVDTREVTDKEQIAALYRIVQSTPGKWRRIRFDSPSLRWYVQFYEGDTLLGSYGVGSNFIAIDRYSMSLDPKQWNTIAMTLRNDAERHK